MDSEKGFTLIELVMVMVMVATLAGFIGNIIYYEVNTYKIVTSRKAGLQDSRFAFSKIARDLRQIVSPDSIHQAAADSIRFDDVLDNTISYKFSENKILRNGDILLESVSTFQFSYYNNNDNQLTIPISDLSDIRSIGLSMSYDVGGRTVSSQLKVTPRNF